MRRIEFLIKQVRRATENNDLAGISTAEFEQYMNDAQDRLQNLIQKAHPETGFFERQGFINLVPTTDTYSLENMVDENGDSFKPRILLFNSLRMVERTQGDIYYPLKFISPKERTTGYGYIVRDKDIIISPTAQGTYNKGLRITYAGKLRDLGIRRGKITNLSPLTVSVLGDATDFDDADFLTIVDKNGVSKVDDVAMEGWNSGTGVITTSTDISNAALDDFVLLGGHSTTHSELPDLCEHYLISYTEMKIFMRDSSADTTAQSSLVSAMEKDIIDLFKDNNGDVVHVPISSTDYLIW